MPNVNAPTMTVPGSLLEGSELERNDAEAAKFRSEADKLEIERDRSYLHYRREHRDRQFAEASDLEHRIYHFRGEVDYESVGYTREHLARWQRMYDPDHDLEIVFNTPGGNAYAGFELYDEILAARSAGHTVTTTGRGLVASMGAILLQAGTVRKVGPSTTLMIHKPSVMVGGDLDEIADVQKMLEDITNRMIDIFAERAASSGAEKPLSKTRIKSGINRKDWFLSAQEALEGGLVDVIG